MKTRELRSLRKSGLSFNGNFIGMAMICSGGPGKIEHRNASSPKRIMRIRQEMMFKTVLSGILCLYIFFLGGCGSDKETAFPEKPLRLRVGNPMLVRQANPLADYSYSIFAMLTTHETLVRFNSAMEPVPQLAKSWESSPDAKQWKFDLTEDALWHDGKPVTAADVKFTFE